MPVPAPRPTAAQIAALIRQNLVLGEVAPHAPTAPLIASIDAAAEAILAAFDASDGEG